MRPTERFSIDQSRFYCVGLDINANHVKSARSGVVYATARPIHLAAKTQVWKLNIANEADALVCVSRLTMLVMAR